MWEIRRERQNPQARSARSKRGPPWRVQDAFLRPSACRIYARTNTDTHACGGSGEGGGGAEEWREWNGWNDGRATRTAGGRSLPFPSRGRRVLLPHFLKPTLYTSYREKKREKKRQTGDAKARVKRTESVQPIRVCHRVFHLHGGGEGFGKDLQRRGSLTSAAASYDHRQGHVSSPAALARIQPGHVITSPAASWQPDGHVYSVPPVGSTAPSASSSTSPARPPPTRWPPVVQACRPLPFAR